MTWREQAKCRGYFEAGRPYWWSKKKNERNLAKRLCSECPVAGECYEEAIRLGETGTIRGGVEL